ncbi:MAG: glycine cleavage system protein GcvH [Wenzhouxiangellaceae bacterium]|nr:glycine cleavage system protein GcvH [Wenzhouxiangellaceae bacterium]
MSEIPSELRFAESHEWVERLEDGLVRIGISDHAQEQLGDLVFIELPEQGSEVTRGEACAVVESVKAASDVYAPVSGGVVAVNDALTDAPETVNNDPYGDGWLFTVKPSDEGDLDELMDADAYAEHVEE